jgi:hypothetical protein
MKGWLALLGLWACTAPLPAAPARSDTPQAETAALAFRIDQRIEAGYKARNVQPAPLADDAEFLRRVYLDLTGRIPPVAEVHRFLKSRDPDKRRLLIEELLASPNYINHFATVWRQAILPPSNNQQQQVFNTQLEQWLRRKLREEVPYNQWAQELLSETNPALGMNGPQPVNQFQRAEQQAAQIFLQANEFKPENLAASASRLFLGVKLECAQCHDHPFARWSRKQFWELAAFFTEVQPQQRGRVVPQPAQPVQPGKREIMIPGTDKIVQARFLDGKDPKLSAEVSSRKLLADWISSNENPYFARAVVNRYWAYFFGVGIVDPVDELENEDNPPSHPELLDELARAFVQKGYDHKFLIRAITSSKSYQLSSAIRSSTQDDVRSFSRMALRGLSAEQLFDSLCQATGYRDPTPNQNVRNIAFALGTPRGEFLNRFDNSADKKTEHQTSILQALALMNGKFIADATSLDRSQTLQAVIESPFLDHRQRLDTLFMAALTRPMRDEEAARFVAYVEKGGPSSNWKKAMADVFWVLLNSSEFNINH